MSLVAEHLKSLVGTRACTDRMPTPSIPPTDSTSRVAPARPRLCRSDARASSTASRRITLPTTIVKRDGRVVAFDPMRIERALSRCFAALDRTPYTPVAELAVRVVNIMSARPGQPTVEIVQDAVELTLQAAGEFEAAKALHPVPRRARQAAPGAPGPRRSPRRLRRSRPVFPDADPEVPVLRQVLALRLRQGPPRDLDRDGRSRRRVPARAGPDQYRRRPRRETVRAPAAHDPRDAQHAVDAAAGHGRRARATRLHRHLQLLRTSRSRASTRSARRC